MSKFFKKMLAVVLAATMIMALGVCSYADSVNYDAAVWTEEAGYLAFLNNKAGSNSYMAYVPANHYIYLDVDNYTKKKLPVIIDGQAFTCDVLDTFYFTPYEDSYVSFICEKNKINIVCKYVSEVAAKAAAAATPAPKATSNDDALAQYYAALEKQQKKSQTTSATPASNEELLAQYYAALEKQQKKAK